jgi:ABC-2 type transport system permease protein
MVSMLTLSALLVVLGSISLIALAALGTEATASFGEVVLGLAALVLAVIPFGLLMLALGYAINPYLVSVATSIAPITLAYLGGLFTDPSSTSGFIATVAPYTPVRGSAELVWAAVGDFTPRPTSLVMVALWTVVLGVLALQAYRRDEGRRFR